MRSPRGAANGSTSARLPLGVGVLCVFACAAKSNSPGPVAAEPPTPHVSTSAAALVDSAGQGLTLDQLQEGLGFRGLVSFRVSRNVRKTGALDPSGESSSGILTIDEHGVMLWSFDDSAQSLRISGYTIRSRDLCMDARHRFIAEWFAVAPLLQATTGAFRIQGVSADGDEASYVAEAEAELFPEVETRVLYRPLDTADQGLEALVVQRWRGAPNRWRTFRYQLRQAADLTSRHTGSFAPCAPESHGVEKENSADSESE